MGEPESRLRPLVGGKAERRVEPMRKLLDGARTDRAFQVQVQFHLAHRAEPILRLRHGASRLPSDVIRRP